MLEVKSTVVDASFNSLKHFAGLQDVLKKICHEIAKYKSCKINSYLELETNDGFSHWSNYHSGQEKIFNQSVSKR